MAPCVPATCRQKHCLTQKHRHLSAFAWREARSQRVGGGDALHAGRGELDLPARPTSHGAAGGSSQTLGAVLQCPGSGFSRRDSDMLARGWTPGRLVGDVQSVHLH